MYHWVIPQAAFHMPSSINPTVRSPRVIATLLIVSVALVAGCSNARTAGQARAPSAPQVQVEPVRVESIRRAIEVVGTLAAEDEVTLSAQAEGQVSRILADLGDRVGSGQTLIELDAEKSQYTVDQQTASFARALAQYGASDVDHLPRVEDTPDVQRALAELEQAKQAADRAQALAQRKLLAQQALDDADATLRAKQAGYNAALQNAKNLRAEIDASAAAMKMAQRQLRDTSIRAPFDGYVQKRLVQLGEYVKVQAPVISLVRMDPLKLTAEIPERMTPWVSIGQAVELHVDAYPDLAVVGKVTRISPAVNPTTRAFAFEARVPNEKALLKPGTFARVHLESGKVDEVTTIAYSALQFRYGANRVFVVEGDHLTAREIKIGDRVGDRVEVVEGLKAGDTVATAEVDTLVDGQKVAADGGGSR
jgi:multidrug efflux pump subunit AcrA (membrane-fusion protein)